jgi:riboflavin synthase
MFTGIIEAIGIVKSIRNESSNLRLTVQSPFTHELKADQSISHNGVCLTVTGIHEQEYEVVAVEETISRTNFGMLKEGDEINLERSMKLGDRLDGHLVQGHVDEIATCEQVSAKDGSCVMTFEYSRASPHRTVEKGSVCVNGISLTVISSAKNKFSVAVIPFTFEHTNLRALKAGGKVNLEFDIIGKYISVLMKDRS